jgi:hypothetical protein
VTATPRTRLRCEKTEAIRAFQARSPRRKPPERREIPSSQGIPDTHALRGCGANFPM